MKNNLIKFNFELAKAGDFSEVKNALIQVKEKSISAQNTLYAIDAACTNPEFLKNFSEGFNKEFKKQIKFRVLTEDEMKIQFDITQTSIAPTIATTVIPSMEALIRSTEILSRINITRKTGESFYQMFDFDAEQNAAVLSEVAGGTDVDEVLRNGDRLIANQKVQASMKLSEFALKSLDGNTLGKYLARLVKRVQHQLCIAILSGGAAAANGTAKGDLIRGILNNYGTNGTGDVTGTIGAVSFATRATTDAAIVALGGVASSDIYDLMIKAKAFLLPTNITDVEEDEYVFIGNRVSWAKVRTVKDLNGRYLAYSMIDDQTGKPKKMIDDTEFVQVPLAQCPTDRIYLVPLKMYTLILDGDIINLNDGGIVQLKEGIVQFVSRTWANGSMEYGQKFRPTTPVTIGTTVPDNNEQNAFRVFNLA